MGIGRPAPHAVLSPEHKELRWVALADLPALPMPDGYRASIRTWAAALGLAA